MGEVYRADDLKLEHPVALKFLPRALEGDPERLERLYGEVRMARQVSHPHVCRVWDVGEAEGQHFISMEFVDGENLASLLRRIGRLPGDKALEIAQQVTSGLAAAHDKGVLHRDLKPANVMLDGQGQVRLTDFGLAGFAESLGDDDVRSGTPSYMSPEQLQGRQVSFRSDIYALGLLLYELFTGRRAFEGRTVAELTRKHRDEHPIPPSAIVPDLSAAVERTIAACLEKDPKKRPPSALAVAAMLAGRDPLEAAIAAGETPSPELVAAAGEHAGLRPALAWACLATVVLGALLVPFAAQPGALLARVPVEKSPAALEDRARELLARIGHAAPAADTAEGLQADEEVPAAAGAERPVSRALGRPADRRAAGRAVLVPAESAADRRERPGRACHRERSARHVVGHGRRPLRPAGAARRPLRRHAAARDRGGRHADARARLDAAVRRGEARPVRAEARRAGVDAAVLLRHARRVDGELAVPAGPAAARRGGGLPRASRLVPGREPLDAPRARPAVRPHGGAATLARHPARDPAGAARGRRRPREAQPAARQGRPARRLPPRLGDLRSRHAELAARGAPRRRAGSRRS